MIYAAVEKMLNEAKGVLASCRAAHVTEADLNIPRMVELLQRLKEKL